jgi:hypothetical protein
MPRNSVGNAPVGATIVARFAAAGLTTVLDARSRSDTLKRPATKAPEKADVVDHGTMKPPPAVSSIPRQSGTPE